MSIIAWSARLSGNTKGIALMAGASASIAVAHSLVHYLGGEMHPFQVTFLRNLVTFVLMVPLLLRGGEGTLRTARPGLQAARGVVGILAMLTWFYALSITPVADATALSFTSALFLTVGAAVVLRERVGPRRWAAVLTGLIGALIVLRPGFVSFGLGSVLTLVSSALWAGSLVMVKILSRTDSSISIVFYSAAYFVVLSIVPAVFVWAWPSWWQVFVVTIIGAMATVSHLLMTQAFHEAEASALTTIDFTRLIWTALIGFFLFDQFPDLWTWIGAGVIIASASYIAFREARSSKSDTGGR